MRYILIYTSMYHVCETLGLSMELNDDILVQTTSPQTIARIKRVKSCTLKSDSTALKTI